MYRYDENYEHLKFTPIYPSDPTDPIGMEVDFGDGGVANPPTSPENSPPSSDSEDDEIDTVLSMNLGSTDTSPFEGRSKAEFCIPAQNWPLNFGLGL